MRITFRNQAALLREYVNRFDAISNTIRLEALLHLAELPLPTGKDLLTFHDSLLFVAAYPSDQRQAKLAEKALERIAATIQSKRTTPHLSWINSGLPFTPTVARFTHDQVRWLMAHPHCRTTLERFDDAALELNDVLKLTLPAVERSETTAGLANNDLMDVLKVPVRNRLSFLIDELSRLDPLPFIKDHLFDQIGVYVRALPLHRHFSKAFNRLPGIETYFQKEFLKSFDIRALLDQPVNPPQDLDMDEKQQVVRVIKNTMVLTARETDPTTYMDEDSLRLYHLGRGISVAIYTMIPSRQLPLESYVGYTAFKNGYAVSYGGSWVFGSGANFGINIFETFRNGESAYIMAQLLRVYRQVFSIGYFEVEPYQFGLDNPEGIASGAFWFYYKFGFRPLDKELRTLAHNEAGKIKSRKGYRTGPKTLIKLTGSNIGLTLDQKAPQRVPDITLQVTKMIQRSYNGQRQLAEMMCREKFARDTGMQIPVDPGQIQVWTEIALWKEALRVTNPPLLSLMAEMIQAKPTDLYTYQELLRSFYSLNTKLT